ncbi:hypothetical protein AB0I22_10650 [Streptomyces sp. NPDC050610]|uniref:hypothetical protein n=1 Tax=Streptomyces sp. NPDC050610 TaxID=3157097 RepID=UPI003416A560
MNSRPFNRTFALSLSDHTDVVETVLRAGGAWGMAPAGFPTESECRRDRHVLARVRTELGRMKWLFS